MPFGISAAPKIFQSRLDAAIQNLPGVFTIADDILVVGMGVTEQDAMMDHDSNIIQLLNRCKEKVLKLNRDKCKIAMPQVAYMGHILTNNGRKPEPTKATAIQKLQKPQDRAGGRRLMGMVNYLSKFLGNLSDLCEPIRKLTRQEVEFCWTGIHDAVFEIIETAVTTTPVLKYFDPA